MEETGRGGFQRREGKAEGEVGAGDGSERVSESVCERERGRRERKEGRERQQKQHQHDARACDDGQSKRAGGMIQQ